ncbi:hypothetical protein GCM10010402_80430 [Actinomadura luteofluorescens]
MRLLRAVRLLGAIGLLGAVRPPGVMGRPGRFRGPGGGRRRLALRHRLRTGRLRLALRLASQLGV